MQGTHLAVSTPQEASQSLGIELPATARDAMRSPQDHCYYDTGAFFNLFTDISAP